MKTYGCIVDESRKKKGLTMEDLGRKCGTQKGYVCGIIRGTVPPPLPRLTRKLCKVLGLNLREMLLLAIVEKAKPKEVRHILQEALVCAGHFVDF